MSSTEGSVSAADAAAGANGIADPIDAVNDLDRTNPRAR